LRRPASASSSRERGSARSWAPGSPCRERRRDADRRGETDLTGVPPNDWATFYDAVAARPPHDTALGALDRFEAPGFAVDLGCGQGRDTFEMLRRGWRVLAIDAEPEAIARLRARAGDEPRLQTLVATFDEAAWPDADLVNASFALPFSGPEHFGEVWNRIVTSIRPGGRFSGQLFGDHDEWVGDPDLTFSTREEALELLTPFELERFDEEDADGQTATGDAKHWHVFHVIGRRRAVD
jgi:SAM-dependent methyltransferase